MHCTPETVQFKDDGRDVYFPTSDCSLVRHWMNEHGAEVKVAWIPKQGGIPLLHDPKWDIIGSGPGQEYTKGPTVWAVPRSTKGACDEARLIQRLVSPASARDYQESRRNLSNAGYPDDVLDAAPIPR